MNQFIWLLAILLYSSVTTAGQESLCDASSKLKKIDSWVNSIKSYDVMLNVLIDGNGASIKSRISGITSKRLKIELNTETDQYTTKQLVIYDGDYQWVEANGPLGTQVVKLNTHKLTKPERPFDTSFYLMGAGLINGEDFPSSLNVILSVYDFDEECSKDDGLILSGQLNKKKFINYLSKSLYSEKKIQSVNQFIDNFSHITLKLETDTYKLKGYGFGTKEKVKIAYVLLDIKINHSLKLVNFKYIPAEKVDVEDITEKVLVQ